MSQGFPADKMVVKYHGVAQPKSAEPHFSGRKEVLFVGRLNPAKGTAVLRDLPSLLPDFTIRIIGAGPSAPMLTSHYRDTSVNNVVMSGRLNENEVHQHISEAPCVIIPSICPESFGLVAAEAMARGTPIVASNIGALTELIQQSGAGVVVPFDQGATPFANAIRRIVDDSEAIRQMGRNGIQFAQDFLTLDQSAAAALVQIYDRVVAEQKMAGNR